VSYLAYGLNGSALTSITASPKRTFSAEGVYSFDATGSLAGTSYEGTSTFGIDKTRPVSSSDVVPVYDGTATVTITDTDALSGPEYILYSLDGASDFATPTATPETTQDFSVSAVTTTPGRHALTWYSVDNAGNQERWHETSFVVNAVGYKPVLGKPKVSVHKRTVVFGGSVTAATARKIVTLTVQRLSGKTSVATYSVWAPKYASAYALSKYINKAGTYRVRATEGSGLSAWSNNFKIK
jgi:hypothetical protein